jgi:hypothetical protein
MKAFIVDQWNGLDYDEYDHSVVGVFATLEEAREYCKNNIPYVNHYNTPMSPYAAYKIEEWEGAVSKGRHELDNNIKTR